MHSSSTACSVQFDPYDLDIDVTPATTRQVLDEKDYPKALVMAFRCVRTSTRSILVVVSTGCACLLALPRLLFTLSLSLSLSLSLLCPRPRLISLLLRVCRLNEPALVQEVLESIPPTAVKVVVELLPTAHITALLTTLGSALPATRHIGT